MQTQENRAPFPQKNSFYFTFLWLFGSLPIGFFFAKNADFFKNVLTSPQLPHFPTLLQNFIQAPFFYLLLLLAGLSLGSYLLEKVFRTSDMPVLDQIIFSIPIGWGLFSWAVLLLGAAGVIHFWVYCGILLLTAAVFRRRWIELFRQGARNIREESQKGPDWIIRSFGIAEIISVSLMLWVVLHGMISSFAPPTDIDSLNYHLGDPAHYILDGKIFYRPGKLSVTFPGNVSMLYVAGLSLGGHVLAQLIQWTFLPLHLCAIVLFGRRFFESRTLGLIAAALFACQPVVTTAIGLATLDISNSFYIFLTFYCMAIWKERRGLQWAALAGVFAGLAVGTKYSSIPIIAMASVTFIMLQIITRQIDFRSLLLFAAVLALTASPWFARNYFWTGNPFHPLFFSVFGGKDLTLEQTLTMSKFQFRPGLEPSFRSFLAIGKEMLTQMRSRPYYNPEFFTWPFILVMGLALIRRPKTPWTVGFFAGIAVLAALPIFCDYSFWRYYISVLSGLCLIWAWGLAALEGRLRHLLWVVLLLMFFAALRLDHKKKLYPIFGMRPAAGGTADPRVQYLETELNHYPAFRFVNTSLPPDAKLLLVEQLDVYHLKHAYLFSDPLYYGAVISYRQCRNAQDLAERLAHLGVTHILYDRKNSVIPNADDRRHLPEWYWRDMELLNEVVRDRSALITTLNDVSIYELRRPEKS